VHSERAGAPIGLTVLYNLDQRHRTACLGVAKFHSDDLSSRILAGAVLFVDYVFSCFELHKLYLEVPEYNLHQVAGIARLLRQEGTLIDHLLADQRRWDMHVFGLDRLRWAELAPRFLAWATRQEPHHGRPNPEASMPDQ
jgi:hypothetical protein